MDSSNLDLVAFLEAGLSPEAADWLSSARRSAGAAPARHLPTLFPQLARRLGRTRLPAGTVEHGDRMVDLSVWRACDAGGCVLLQDGRPADDLLVDLYRQGDLEERTAVLRSLAVLPVTGATGRLLHEVQRSNVVTHVEAAALDSNLVVRALGAAASSGFTGDDFRRLVLKVAFLDLPAWRMFGAYEAGDPVLSDMLQGYASEREAAGRTVWKDTYRFLGHAPTAGSVARILGGIEHGDDDTRLAAAEGFAALRRPDLAPYARERLAREPRPAIRALLTRAAT